MTSPSPKSPFSLSGSMFLLVFCLAVLIPWTVPRAQERAGGPVLVSEDLPGGVWKIPGPLASALRALGEGAFEEAARLAEGYLRAPEAVVPDGQEAAWRARARMVAARAHLESGRAAEALEALGGEETEFPAGLRAHARFLRGRALEALGDASAAAAAYEAARKAPPTTERTDAAALEAAFRSWLGAGNCVRASEAARMLEARHPGHPGVPKALLTRARCLEDAGEKAEAVRVYHRLWLDHPVDLAADEAGRRLFALKKQGEEIPRPSTGELLARARALQEARKIPEAARTWKAVLERSISSSVRAEAVFHLGLDHYFLRKNRLAAERLRWTAEHDKTGKWAPRALYYLARLHLREGEREAFRRTGRELLQAHPSDPWTRQFLYLRARVVEDRGNLEEALGQYRHLADGHPDTRQGDLARWRVGWVLYRLGRFDKAEDAFARLGRERPQTPSGQAGYYWAGRAAERRGKSPDGHYRAARALDPTSYYGHLASAGLGGPPDLVSPADGESPRFAERPPLRGRVKEAAGRADRLLLAGLFQAAAGVLEDAGLGDPYSAFQRARLLHRARDHSGALRILLRPTFWRERVGRRPAPDEFFRILYPIDRRALRFAGGKGGYPVDPLLVSAITLAESLYDPEALSIAGARGLMQLMPETAARIAKRLGLPPPSPDDLFRPDLNVRLGSDFLGRLVARFGGARAPAIAAYNAGLEAAQRWWKENGHLDEASFIARIPYSETRRYTRRVLGYYRQYQAVYGDFRADGKTPP